MLAIVEDHAAAKALLGMLEPIGLQAGFAGTFIVGPRSGILAARLLRAFLGTDNGGAGVHPNAISEQMVRMVVGVEDIADGLGGSGADVGQNILRAPGIIGVDHQHIVAENDPAAVGDD